MRELTVTASRRLLAGGLIWLSLLQVFVVNYAIVLPRASNRSLVHEIISALGITRCKVIDGIRFCSPWHEAADSAWIAGGACLAVGALLNAAILAPDRLRNMGFGALTLSGVGLLASGMNPYNLRPAAHLLSAGTCFIAGGVGVLLLGIAFRQADRPFWGTSGIVCGVTSLVFTALTALKPDVGIQGLFERTAAWPSIVWVIGTGAAIVRLAWRASRKAGR